MASGSARGARWRRRRAAVLEQSNVCWLCGHPGADSVDHVVPRVLGGSDDYENLRPAHARCNAVRGARAVTVRRPTSRDWYA